MNMNNIYGIKAENYFSSIMNKIGLEHKYVDDWYDFIVGDKHKRVEIKSCELSVKNTKNKNKTYAYRLGRFHFNEKKNRDLQYNNNIWVCFILRHENDFIILGFIKARKLKKRKQICIHDLRRLEAISLEKWVKIINR